MVAAEIVDIERRELLRHSKPKTSGGVAGDPAGVGDVGDDASVTDPVGGPTDGANIRVVELAFQFGGRLGGIGGGDRGIKCGVRLISIVVVGAALPRLVRRFRTGFRRVAIRRGCPRDNG